MSNCCCSLDGTMACLSCSRWTGKYGYSYHPAVWPSTGTEVVQVQPEKKVHRITKTFEYDKNGRVTKEIIEEE